jgi:hypothetical protein
MSFGGVCVHDYIWNVPLRNDRIHTKYMRCILMYPMEPPEPKWINWAHLLYITCILRRWQELQSFYTKIVLTVRNAKFGSSKGPRPPIAQKLCITHSGTAHWLCMKIRAFNPLNN